MAKKILTIFALSVLLIGCSPTNEPKPKDQEIPVEEDTTPTITPNEEKTIKVDELPTVTKREIGEGMICKYGYYDENDELYGIQDEFYCFTSSMERLSGSSKFLAHMNKNKEIQVYNFSQRKNYTLMTVLPTTEGVDFYWSPDEKTLAMTVMNWEDESYEPDRTKIYILKLDDNGSLLSKERYNLKVLFKCHDAGCNTSEEDVYFKDNNTLIYRTWESETTYEDVGREDLLRELVFN